MRSCEILAIEEREKKILFLLNLGYSKEESISNLKKLSSPLSEIYWIYKGLSKSEAQDKISNLQKERSPRCKEYWIKKGFSEIESEAKVSIYQDNVSLKATLNKGQNIEDYNKKCNNRKINKEKYISLYGEEIGTEKWMDKKEKSKITLSNLIRVHGEIEGPSRWDIYLKKQKYSNSNEGLIENHGQKGYDLIEFRKNLYSYKIDKFIETNDYKYINKFYSKSSQDFFWSIYNLLPQNLKDKCYFKELNNEFVVAKNRQCYLYDFVISNINFCIEFNGDFWHANPKNYIESDLILNKKASDIWEHDSKKINFLKLERNIDCLIVWESDWKINKHNTIENILSIINKRIKYDNNN